MSEERMEVLRMVADKVINVEEAERLLRALEDGERRRSEPPRRPAGVAAAFDGVSEALGAIGHVVQSTVADAMEGVEDELHISDADDDEAGTELDAPDFEIPAGGRLSIRRSSRTGRMSGCTLTLVPGEGDRCTVEAGEGAELRARRKGLRTRIQWLHGPLTVRVPSTVAELDAKVLGGDLFARALGCPVEAQVMGGRLELRGLRQTFNAKVMGGTMLLGLAPGLQGSSRARAVGGEVVVVVPDGIHARITAVSTGGEVRVDSGLGKVQRDGSKIQRRTVIGLGLDSADAAEISLKTVGGDVVVRREEH